jgi:hypothetical protein
MRGWLLLLVVCLEAIIHFRGFPITVSAIAARG